MGDKGRNVVAEKARALKHLRVEYLPTQSIKPNPWNPNRQDDQEFQLLIRSMQEDGFTQPVVAVRLDEKAIMDPAFVSGAYDVGDVVIVDGEHRWRAGAQLAMAEIPVVIAPMTPEQMRIATLRHNRARGSEDIELTAQVLRDLRALGALDWAQESLMLDDVDMEKMLADISAPDALAAEAFSRAWAPDRAAGEMKYSEDDVAAGTVAAVEAQREKEKRVAAAKTEEERAAAARDEGGVVRFSMMFAGDEAKVVKRVLGDQPAVKVLELCRAAAEAAER